MTLIEAMKSNGLVYVAYAPRWLIYEGGSFTVYEQIYHKKVRRVCETDSEAIAVAALLNEEAEDA